MFKPMGIPSTSYSKPNKFYLDQFLGCDYTSGNMLSDIRRSPNAENMIWGSNPRQCETRAGYKAVLNNPIQKGNLKQKIWGVHTFSDETVSQILIHAGTDLYIVDGDGNAIMVFSNLTETHSQSFVFGDYLYIIGCGKYLRWDGLDCVTVESVAFVPTTVINSFPSKKWTDTYFGDGEKTTFELSRNADKNSSFLEVYLNSAKTEDYTYSAGIVTFATPIIQNVEVRLNYLIKAPTGVAFEAVNLLTPQRINSFVGNGITTEFYLGSDEDDEDDDKLDAKNIDSIDEVKILGVETTDYTANLAEGTVTFTVAPPDGDGIDNVTIKFSKAVNSDIINKCDVFGIFGGDNDTRVFLSGNPDFPNIDWYSGLYDPTYFPDNAFTHIGSDNTALMGYVEQFDTQMPIKQGNSQDKTAFLRQFTIVDGVARFPIEQGAVGTGAISKRAFGYLQGEPLFLSPNGVVGVMGTEVDNHRLIQDRSTLINPELTAEKDLQNAFALVYENKYHLFVNGHCYVCDARMRYTDNLGQVQYEWLYWKNVYATAGAIFKGYMYIGYEGQLYRFKKNEPDLYSDNEMGIQSKWTTPVLYFGDTSVRKTLNHIYVLMSNISENDITIRCVINGNIEVYLGNIRSVRKFRYSEFRYSTFSYVGRINRYSIKLKANLKKIDNVQFIFSNDGENLSAAGMTLFQADYILLSR